MAGKTCGGYIVRISDEQGNFNVVLWRCRALRRVLRLTMAAETMQLGDMVDETEILAHTWQQMMHVKTSRIDCRSRWGHLYKSRKVTEKQQLVELAALK